GRSGRDRFNDDRREEVLRYILSPIFLSATASDRKMGNGKMIQFQSSRIETIVSVNRSTAATSDLPASSYFPVDASRCALSTASVACVSFRYCTCKRGLA